MSWTHGRHYIRFGANIPQISRRAWDDRTNRLGTFSFANLASFQANRPYAYTVQQGPGRAVFWFNEVGGFFQDQIKLTKNVQASIGLRYDWQTFLHDNNNFAPRASLAWSPGKSQKTVIRIGYGVFFDRTGGDTLANIVLHDGVLLRSYQIENPALPESGREP
jgi:outer membrane receptor protein involved in Fe transport